MQRDGADAYDARPRVANTRQIYTQVSIRQLKAIRTTTHPGRTPVARAQADALPAANRDTLLATFDAEAAEEAG